MTLSPEDFWQGEFGNEYTDRNAPDHLASHLNLWGKILSRTKDVNSVFEIGTNRGLNLDAIKLLNKDIQTNGVEINSKACDIAKSNGHNVINSSAVNLNLSEKFDIVYTRGVLIHIDPDLLQDVYQRMFDLSNQYILIDEYFNPTPVAITYREHEGKLFKRDFAKELVDKFDLELVDYGFTWKHDPCFPLDNMTWFLLRKK